MRNRRKENSSVDLANHTTVNIAAIEKNFFKSQKQKEELMVRLSSSWFITVKTWGYSVRAEYFKEDQYQACSVNITEQALRSWTN